MPTAFVINERVPTSVRFLELVSEKNGHLSVRVEEGSARIAPCYGLPRKEAAEERGERMTRRLLWAATLAAVVALLTAGAALADAGGRGTVTITQHAHNDTLFSDAVTNPCTGEPGTLTAIAANEVFHVTFFTVSDEFWVTGTDEGMVTFTPDDPSGFAASGHFAAWFGASFNEENDGQPC